MRGAIQKCRAALGRQSKAANVPMRMGGQRTPNMRSRSFCILASRSGSLLGMMGFVILLQGSPAARNWQPANFMAPATVDD